MKIKTIFILGLFLLALPFSLFAQGHYGYETSFIFKRDVAMQKALDATEREIVIGEALRKITIEMTLGYGFTAGGKQTFEVVDEQGNKISKLEYPYRGGMLIVKGEAGLWSKVFLGGRYGNSNFKKRVCSDEDWDILYDLPHPIFGNSLDYQITKQMSESKAKFFDINLYYRLLDFDKEKPRQNYLFPNGDDILNHLLVDKLALDIFVGYQYQKNRSRMIDPMTEARFFDEGIWYYAGGLPANIGLNSFYEIEYKGPRIGLRATGSKGKFTTKIGFAYALLETKAEGWWNLRNYSFWQKGQRGSGLDVELETSYAFNPHLSLGLGFDFIYRHQKKLKESGTQPGYSYQDLDIIRNANSIIYFPSVLLKFIW